MSKPSPAYAAEDESTSPSEAQTTEVFMRANILVSASRFAQTRDRIIIPCSPYVGAHTQAIQAICTLPVVLDQPPDLRYAKQKWAIR